MGGFGDLFGALGELIGGAFGAAAESAPDFVAEAAFGGERGAAAGEALTYERYLVGGRRTLNINDI